MKLRNKTVNINTDEFKKEWADFICLLTTSAEEKQLDALLQLILTPDEREALPTRILIVKELLAGKLTQRELKTYLGTGIATITRGSNSLKHIEPNFKNWLESQFFRQSLDSDEI